MASSAAVLDWIQQAGCQVCASFKWKSKGYGRFIRPLNRTIGVDCRDILMSEHHNRHVGLGHQYADRYVYAMSDPIYFRSTASVTDTIHAVICSPTLALGPVDAGIQNPGRIVAETKGLFPSSVLLQIFAAGSHLAFALLYLARDHQNSDLPLSRHP